MKLNDADKFYIKDFVDEILLLYEGDVECFIPQYVEDMAKNVKIIIGDYIEEEQEEPEK